MQWQRPDQKKNKNEMQNLVADGIEDRTTVVIVLTRGEEAVVVAWTNCPWRDSLAAYPEEVEPSLVAVVLRAAEEQSLRHWVVSGTLRHRVGAAERTVWAFPHRRRRVVVEEQIDCWGVVEEERT
jgi:hypothetical protein